MRRIAAGILALSIIAGTGCSEPRLDATSEDTLKKSSAHVREALTPDERDRFDRALQTVIMNGVSFGGLIKGGIDGIIADTQARINKKSARDIIAEAERIEAARRAEAIAQARAEIAELREKKAQADRARAGLASFRVLKSRFRTEQEYSLRKPFISLTLKNEGRATVARAYFTGIISSKGRSVPWFKDDFNYEIPGGIEPGETQSWELAPSPFSGWGRAEVPVGAVFTVEVVRLDGANGEVMYDARAFGEEEARRLSALVIEFGGE